MCSILMSSLRPLGKLTVPPKGGVDLEQLVKCGQSQASLTAFAISENIVPLMG